MNQNVVKIVGIKKTESKDGKSVFYNYFYTKPFSDYEVDTALELSGVTCGSEFSLEPLDCKVGDEVEFLYTKGFGDRAQLIGCNMVKPLTDVKGK